MKRCYLGESTGLDSISQVYPSLPNIEFLIDYNGEISITSMVSIICAAVTADEARCLAMLVHREGETLRELLIRFDRAIEIVRGDKNPDEEINNGYDDPLGRPRFGRRSTGGFLGAYQPRTLFS